jgi:hypothetical protein
MTDYSKTVIYKIQHLDKDELLYVGHTSNFIKRKNNHKSSCKTHSLPLYKMMRENGGWDCFTMIVLKDFPCDSKTEACIEEDKVMREMKASMNKNRAYTTPEEYYQANKELISEKKKEYRQEHIELLKKKDKERYQANREIINEKQKEYHQANKELISERRKVHYHANKELISERQKEYRQANGDKINEQKREPIECECGCIITKMNLAKHKKTKKHLNLII